MNHILLVHGAWGSSASWSPVARGLRDNGWQVSVPSLTGLGERRHLFRGDINLSTHIADVAAHIDLEGLERFVLAAHSYGGMVATAIADRFADRVAGLLYLDAFVPRDGQSLLDLLGPEAALANIAQAGEMGGFAVPPPERHAAGVPEAMRHHLQARTPHPLACMVERPRLSGAQESIERRHYVSAARGQAPVFARIAEAVRADPRWTHETLDTGHMLHLERPDDTVAIIEAFVNGCR